MMRVKSLQKLAIACVPVGLSLATAPAQADIFAYAKLLVSEFTISGSDGQILDADEDFSSLVFTSAGDMEGVLTGTAGYKYDIPNTSGEVDFPADCLTTTGDCNPLDPDNSFPFLTGPQGTDFVASDQLQSGAPILGLGLDAPAIVGSIAAANLSTTAASGSANVNTALESSFTFSLTQDQGITFDLDVELYLEAFASAGELAPGKASAATTFGLTITDLSNGQIVFDSGSNGGSFLTQTTSVNANSLPMDVQTCGLLAPCGNEFQDSLSFSTDVLQAGTLYQLAVRNNVNVDLERVEEVPAPGVIALIGAGFLGLFAVRRRRAS